jgi:DNA-binding NtrC family response regulator
MPILTGEELIQEIKQIRPDILTILYTGYSSLVDEDKAKELGIDAFMMKPIDLPQLLHTIRRVLDREEKE